MNTVIKGTKSITEFKRKKSELTSGRGFFRCYGGQEKEVSGT